MGYESSPFIQDPPPLQQEKLPDERRKRKRLFRSPLLLWAGVGIFVLALFKGVDFIVVDKEGNPTLSEKRKKKLEKDLENLDEAEQYVLLAVANGWYPCYNCPGSTSIYLLQGQIYKYGVTKLGQAGRYRQELKRQGLVYFIEFQGTLPACLKEERKKIILYAVHPENLARDTPLIRPPGNKRDD